MDTYGWLSLLPPLLAIGLAIKSRQVFLSLGAGIWLGWTIISSWNPIKGMAGMLNSIVMVFQDPGNTQVIIFSALVGSLIALTQRSGGIDGFVEYILNKKWIRSRKGANLLAWTLGLVIFIESSIKILVVGSVCRPLYDKMGISREKLAYIADSTSAPICMLIPLNAWGAFTIGLLAIQGVENPTQVLIRSIPLNFYSIIAVLTVLFFILTPFDFGKMKKAEKRVREEGKILPDGATPMMDENLTNLKAKSGVKKLARNMIVPILVMSIFMPIGLVITGLQNLSAAAGVKVLLGEAFKSVGLLGLLAEGSGSTAVFWSVMLAIVVASLMTRFQKTLSGKEIMELILKGAGGMISLALLMMLAFSLGSTCKELGTGAFVAQGLSAALPASLVPLVVFLVAAFIAFSTGTSFGTFALMIPLAVPLAVNLGVSMPLVVSAVLGGGVFGDHCSPISDTTIVASMASACDHIDHVNTQLPYALLSAGIASIIYLIVGLIVV
ncbi:MAG: Na+/H+ antiporter NhaC family protein [Candidatus Neomarinimicrobiota bacterium]